MLALKGRKEINADEYINKMTACRVIRAKFRIFSN